MDPGCFRMFLALACLIGLSLAGPDDSTVPAASPRATAESPARRPASIMATPQDDAVDGVPEDFDGDDEDDPGEAMNVNGPSHQPSASVAIGGSLGAVAPLPSSLPPASPIARFKPRPLSVLCRLLF